MAKGMHSDPKSDARTVVSQLRRRRALARSAASALLTLSVCGLVWTLAGNADYTVIVLTAMSGVTGVAAVTTARELSERIEETVFSTAMRSGAAVEEIAGDGDE